MDIDKKKYRKNIEKKTKSKLRKRIFVAHVTNPDSDTFCNYTKAASKAFPGHTRGAAANLGSDLMKDSYVLNEIERVIEAAGIGFTDRVNALRDIIYSNLTRESVTLIKDADTGNWKGVQKTVTEPSFTERVNAMRVLNQMDGTDKKVSQNMQQRDKLMTAMRKKLLRDIDACELQKNHEKSLKNHSKNEFPKDVTQSEDSHRGDSNTN